MQSLMRFRECVSVVAELVGTCALLTAREPLSGEPVVDRDGCTECRMVALEPGGNSLKLTNFPFDYSDDTQYGTFCSPNTVALDCGSRR